LAFLTTFVYKEPMDWTTLCMYSKWVMLSVGGLRNGL